MIKPLDNRLVVEPIVRDRSTLLWVPQETSTKTWRGFGEQPAVTVGRVVAVGPGKYQRGKRRPVEARVGDVVHFSDSCYRPFRDGDKEYGFIREDDIVGKE